MVNYVRRPATSVTSGQKDLVAIWVFDEEVASKSFRALSSRLEFWRLEEQELGNGARNAWDDIQQLYEEHWWPCPKADKCCCNIARTDLGPRLRVNRRRSEVGYPCSSGETAAAEMQRQILYLPIEVRKGKGKSSKIASASRGSCSGAGVVEAQTVTERNCQNTNVKDNPVGNRLRPAGKRSRDLDDMLNQQRHRRY